MTRPNNVALVDSCGAFALAAVTGRSRQLCAALIAAHRITMGHRGSTAYGQRTTAMELVFALARLGYAAAIAPHRGELRACETIRHGTHLILLREHWVGVHGGCVFDARLSGVPLAVDRYRRGNTIKRAWLVSVESQMIAALREADLWPALSPPPATGITPQVLP